MVNFLKEIKVYRQGKRLKFCLPALIVCCPDTATLVSNKISSMPYKGYFPLYLTVRKQKKQSTARMNLTELLYK